MNIDTKSKSKHVPKTECEIAYPLIAIRKGKTITTYHAQEQRTEVPCSRLFTLTKHDDRSHYNCLVCDDPRYSNCDCRGFESNRHCKHLDTLQSLISQQLIPSAAE